MVLCGRSGSGKTHPPAAPEVCADAPRQAQAADIRFCGTFHWRRCAQRGAGRPELAIVMQNPDEQIVTDKVWHELAFGLESLGCDQKTMRARVAEMACYFGIQDWFHRDVDSLSGGQKQLLNLASVMAMQPEVLILDEPTSQLDPIAASDFLNTVRKINLELGTTVLITEHRLEDILPAADRAVVMEGGRILVADVPRRTAGFLWAEHHPMFSAMPAPTAGILWQPRGRGYVL
ncbi:MAG: energy-coupling factor ABC transporter ATP-binding protein [Oscillospiraceae bacterium]